jgi:chromosome segregation ATPase
MARKEEKYELRPIVEQAIWSVWGYVRENKDSLESGRHCEGISRLVRLAMVEMDEINQQQRQETKEAISEKRKYQDVNRELKKDVKELETELREVRSDLASCEKRLERLGGAALLGKKAAVKKKPSKKARKRSPLRKFVKKRRPHGSTGGRIPGLPS